MRLGLWTPLPHVIRPEPEIVTAREELATPGRGQPVDRSFGFALDAVRRAEDLGFDITLVAERFVAPDLAEHMKADTALTGAAAAVAAARRP